VWHARLTLDELPGLLPHTRLASAEVYCGDAFEVAARRRVSCRLKVLRRLKSGDELSRSSDAARTAESVGQLSSVACSSDLDELPGLLPHTRLAGAEVY
jgi:hypothetical protein